MSPSGQRKGKRSRGVKKVFFESKQFLSRNLNKRKKKRKIPLSIRCNVTPFYFLFRRKIIIIVIIKLENRKIQESNSPPLVSAASFLPFHARKGRRRKFINPGPDTELHSIHAYTRAESEGDAVGTTQQQQQQQGREQT